MAQRNKSSIDTPDSKAMHEWAYVEILKAHDRGESMERIASLIFLAGAKWGADNVRRQSR